MFALTRRCGTKWTEFAERLALELDTQGCGAGADQSLARRVLSTMPDVDVEATLDYCYERGGHCDCEILMNIDCDDRDDGDEDDVWLTAKEAAARAGCNSTCIRHEARGERLRVARVSGLRGLRFLPEWIDEWLTPVPGYVSGSGATSVILDVSRPEISADDQKRETQ